MKKVSNNISPSYNSYTLENFQKDCEFISPKIQRSISYSTDRDNIQNWVADLFSDFNCSMQTRILTSYYIDDFFIKKPDLNLHIKKLSAVICFGIALKFQENTRLNPKDISMVFEGGYTEDSINTMELYILKTLNWKLVYKTPSDVIRLLISATCEKGDLGKVIEKAELFALVGILSSTTVCYNENMLAIACISLALRTLGFEKFFEEWWRRVTSFLYLSQNEVEDIENKIIKIVS